MQTQFADVAALSRPRRHGLQPLDRHCNPPSHFLTMATNVSLGREQAAVKPHLMGLPSEIRLQVLHYLLSLPSYEAEVHRTVKYTLEPWITKSPRSIRNYFHGEAQKLYPQTLQTCRILNEEGRRVISNNRLVRIKMPSAKLQAVAEYTMSLYEIPTSGETSAQPLMDIDVQPSDDQGSSHREYLLEFRNIQLLVWYLLPICRPKGVPACSIRIDVRRTELPGLYTAANAAKRLILDPIYPSLNGAIDLITCCGKELRLDQVNSYKPRESSMPKSPADQLINDIYKFIIADTPEPPTNCRRWKMRPSQQLWTCYLSTIHELARTGTWRPSPSFPSQLFPTLSANSYWEMVELDFLTRGASWSCWGSTFLNLGTFIKQSRYLSAVICLNLSYLPPSPGCPFAIHKHNPLHLTPHIFASLAHDLLSELEDRETDEAAIEKEASTYYIWFLDMELNAIRCADPGEDPAPSSRAVKSKRQCVLDLVEKIAEVEGIERDHKEWRDEIEMMADAMWQEWVRTEEEGDLDLERWEDDSWFRGRFLRKMCREVLMPLVLRRCRDEAGRWFREAVPEDIDGWIEAVQS